MDIRLPGIDGLELSRKIIGQYPNVQIVILSAYNEFSYAAQGIELGVFRYLVKHELTPEKLSSLLAELRSRIEMQEQDRIMMEEQILYGFIMHGPDISSWNRGAAKLQSQRLRMGAIITLQSLDKWIYDLPDEGEQKKMRVSISQLLSFRKEEVHAKYILSFDDRLLVFTEEGSCTSEAFDKLLSSMSSNLQERSSAPVKYILFSGSVPAGELRECNELITQRIPALLFCSHRRSLYAEDEVSGGLKSHPKEDESTLIATGQEYGGVSDTDESGADDSQKSPGRILMNAFREKDSALFLQTARDICGGSMKESVSSAVLSRFYYADDALPALQEAALEAEKKQEQEREVSPTTRFILRYIDRNYRNTISLQQIADDLNANVMYIGRIFQKDMGVNFRTYLNEYRIRIAQQLLRSTNRKVFEISEEVGIPNGQYFSRLFRQQTGCSPNEYRQRFFLVNERQL